VPERRRLEAAQVAGLRISEETARDPSIGADFWALAEYNERVAWCASVRRKNASGRYDM
jgi:hypothetical protein